MNFTECYKLKTYEMIPVTDLWIDLQKLWISVMMKMK